MDAERGLDVIDYWNPSPDPDPLEKLAASPDLHPEAYEKDGDRYVSMDIVDLQATPRVPSVATTRITRRNSVGRRMVG